MLKTQIKASSIANLTDARYFAAWHVEWLGFNLDTASENYCSPTQVQALKAWVEGPKMIGEFGVQQPDEIQTTVQLLQLDGVQIGPFTSAQALSELLTVPIIKSIILDAQSDELSLGQQLEKEAPYVQAFLLNFDKNHLDWAAIKNDKPFSLSTLQTFCQQYPLLLSIDLRAEEVDEVIETLYPYGLSLKGGEEEKTGFKSFDELDDIFEALEILE